MKKHQQQLPSSSPMVLLLLVVGQLLLMMMATPSVHAFSPAAFQTSSFKIITSKSTRLDVATSTTDESTSTTNKKQPLTRFDRLKQTYKGPRVDTSDEDVDFTYQDFASAVANTNYSFARNQIVRGTVIEYDRNGAIVDIGAKANAYLPESEVSLSFAIGNLAGNTKFNVEDFIDLNTEQDFEIISEEDEHGQLLVSIRRIQFKQAWERVQQLYEDDAVLEAPVIAINRGGAICLVENGLRAFLPGSHLVGQMPTEDLIGQTLPLKFLEVNSETNKLVVSNRRAVVEEQMADLSRGDVVEGIVKALKPYGAFVEIGGMSGLLHISQISYDRIDDLEQVLQPGMHVKCMIIDHDKVNGRIALATKTLEPQAGDMLRDPATVFEKAEETAQIYHERLEAERKAREEAARDIVLGLGDSLDDIGGGGVNGNDDDDDEVGGSSGGGDANNDDDDPLSSVSDSLDSLLS